MYRNYSMGSKQMKKLDLAPTNSNVLETFCQDAIDRNIDVVHFCNVLDSINDSYTISLDSQWGSGKTFFIKQVKMLIDYLNSSSDLDKNTREKLDAFCEHKPETKAKMDVKNDHATIYYDAWENDNDIDPILSLIYAVTKDTQFIFNTKPKRDVSDIIGAIADIATGRNVNQFFNAIKGEDMMECIQREKSIAELMKEFIDNVIDKRVDRLIIFIDELDRCKPTFAVQMLERIKHFFFDDRVTFVFSVNIEQLQYTIKNYYGEGFNASRYLDKFFDLRIGLPDANYNKYIKSIGFSDSTYIYDKMCFRVINYFHFQLREMAKYIRFIKISDTKFAREFGMGFANENAISFSAMYIVPIMLGLKIYDIGKFNDFIEGRDASPMIEILSLPEVGLDNQVWMLSGRETFDKDPISETDIEIISMDQRLTEIYNALFVENRTGKVFEKHIGNMEFDAQTRKTIKQIVRLLSPYSNFDV